MFNIVKMVVVVVVVFVVVIVMVLVASTPQPKSWELLGHQSAAGLRFNPIYISNRFGSESCLQNAIFNLSKAKKGSTF